jgi:N-acetylglucosamine malate deacetylase 1
MNLREIIVRTPWLFSLWRPDRSDLKRFARRFAIKFCRGLLRIFSRHYVLNEGVTLVFSPHQDDETLGCGGLIARKRNEGLPVHVVFITDGSSSHPGHPKLTPAAVTALRRTEALTALAILGVESSAIHFLNERDGRLNSLEDHRRAALVENLSALIKDIKPDEIFLPCYRDGSDEHTATFVYVCEAIRRSQHRLIVWQYPVWAWWKPGYLFENLLLSRESRCLPMEDFQLIKSRALACYLSQVQPTLPWRDPVLPPELRTTHEFGEEYFFRFNPPERIKGESAAQLVV